MVVERCVGVRVGGVLWEVEVEVVFSLMVGWLVGCSTNGWQCFNIGYFCDLGDGILLEKEDGL